MNMKWKGILFLIIVTCCLVYPHNAGTFDMPQTPDNLRVMTIIVEFNSDGEVDTCVVRGVMMKDGITINKGSKNITSSLTPTLINQFKTFRTNTENAIKASMGL